MFHWVGIIEPSQLHRLRIQNYIIWLILYERYLRFYDSLGETKINFYNGLQVFIFSYLDIV